MVYIYLGRDNLYHGGNPRCETCGFDMCPSTAKHADRDTVYNMCTTFEPPIDRTCTWTYNRVARYGKIKSYLPRKTNLDRHVDKNHPGLITQERGSDGKLGKTYNILGNKNSKFPRFVIMREDGIWTAVETRKVRLLNEI
jgi:hypothetical protein